MLRRNSFTVLGAPDPATTTPSSSSTTAATTNTTNTAQTASAAAAALPPRARPASASGTHSGSAAAAAAGGEPQQQQQQQQGATAARQALASAVREVLLCSRKHLLPAVMTGEGWEAQAAQQQQALGQGAAGGHAGERFGVLGAGSGGLALMRGDEGQSARMK